MPINRRLLELALMGLETARERIDTEMAEIRGQLRTDEPTRAKPSRGRVVKMSPGRRRRTFSTAQRRAASARMKKYWAQRRREAA